MCLGYHKSHHPQRKFALPGRCRKGRGRNFGASPPLSLPPSKGKRRLGSPHPGAASLSSFPGPHPPARPGKGLRRLTHHGRGDVIAPPLPSASDGGRGGRRLTAQPPTFEFLGVGRACGPGSYVRLLNGRYGDGGRLGATVKILTVALLMERLFFPSVVCFILVQELRDGCVYDCFGPTFFFRNASCTPIGHSQLPPTPARSYRKAEAGRRLAIFPQTASQLHSF